MRRTRAPGNRWSAAGVGERRRPTWSGERLARRARGVAFANSSVSPRTRSSLPRPATGWSCPDGYIRITCFPPRWLPRVRRGATPTTNTRPLPQDGGRPSGVTPQRTFVACWRACSRQETDSTTSMTWCGEANFTCHRGRKFDVDPAGVLAQREHAVRLVTTRATATTTALRAFQRRRACEPEGECNDARARSQSALASWPGAIARPRFCRRQSRRETRGWSQIHADRPGRGRSGPSPRHGEANSDGHSLSRSERASTRTSLTASSDGRWRFAGGTIWP